MMVYWLVDWTRDKKVVVYFCDDFIHAASDAQQRLLLFVTYSAISLYLETARNLLTQTCSSADSQDCYLLRYVAFAMQLKQHVQNHRRIHHKHSISAASKLTAG